MVASHIFKVLQLELAIVCKLFSSGTVEAVRVYGVAVPFSGYTKRDPFTCVYRDP